VPPVATCAICGSDLHIFDGVIPRMKSGDVLGHENKSSRSATASWCRSPSPAAAFEAMMDGKGDVVSGWCNKLQTAIATVTPAGYVGRTASQMAQPGSAKT
jgi:hypothetical protein